MKLRQHLGGLAESMATTIEIEPTLTALLDAVRATISDIGADVTEQTLKVTPRGLDPRTGWDTHIVTISGFGVYGYTDGPLVEPPNTALSRPGAADD